jgi:hypothetical protein
MLRDLQCTRSAQAAIAGLDRYAAAGSQGPPFANTNLAERVGSHSLTVNAVYREALG